MDLVNAKGKKSLIIKTWERCRSFGANKHNSSSSNISRALVKKSKSCPLLEYTSGNVCNYSTGVEKKRKAPAEGCFSVYVGPQKQRFVIKTRYVNHPLFRMLLEEAESEYGYCSEGPLALPCNVDIFVKLLVEMDSDEIIQKGCSTFIRSPSSYRVLSHGL